MDHLNRFATKRIFWTLRAEYGAALILCTVLFFIHINDIRWIPAIILFVYIDIIGYIPGAIAFRRSKDGNVNRVYYMLYNIMHSFVLHFVVVGVWIAVYGFEWALLVIPIHLCGDRALFGNVLKAYAVRFEPVEISEFAEFDRSISGGKVDQPQRTSSYASVSDSGVA